MPKSADEELSAKPLPNASSSFLMPKSADEELSAKPLPNASSSFFIPKLLSPAKPLPEFLSGAAGFFGSAAFFDDALLAFATENGSSPCLRRVSSASVG